LKSALATSFQVDVVDVRLCREAAVHAIRLRSTHNKMKFLVDQKPMRWTFEFTPPLVAGMEPGYSLTKKTITCDDSSQVLFV
jgi:hypothetical protein